MADLATHEYALYEAVELFANKVNLLLIQNLYTYATHKTDLKKWKLVRVTIYQVAPYANPSETYEYYSLPFCRPDGLKSGDNSLGEILSGDRKVHMPIIINFKGSTSIAAMCTFIYREILNAHHTLVMICKALYTTSSTVAYY